MKIVAKVHGQAHVADRGGALTPSLLLPYVFATPRDMSRRASPPCKISNDRNHLLINSIYVYD